MNIQGPVHVVQAHLPYVVVKLSLDTNSIFIFRVFFLQSGTRLLLDLFRRKLMSANTGLICNRIFLRDPGVHNRVVYFRKD